MPSILRQLAGGTSAAGDPGRRDPQQLAAGQALISYFRAQRPGQWLSNHLAESQHYTGPAYLALSHVVRAWTSVIAHLERRKRRDRTTFGPGGSVATVKAVAHDGGAGNDEDYSPVHDHPAAERLREPNPGETFGSLLGYMALQKGLTGEAPVWFVPGLGHGKPVELYALNTALLQPAFQSPSPQYPQGAWRFTPYYGGGPAWAYGSVVGASAAAGCIIPGAEVRRLLNPHPLTRVSGYSTFQACGRQIDILEGIDDARHSQMLQAAYPGVLVSVPGMSEEQTEATAAKFNEQYAGARNYLKAMVFSPPAGTDASKATVTQLTPSADKLAFAESWDQATNFIFASFDILPTTVGLAAQGGYAERYAARQDQRDRYADGVKAAADFFTQHLARPWSRKPGELRVKLQMPKVVNLERDTPSVQDMLGANSITVNELRALKDMPPVRFGDLPPAQYAKKVESVEFPQPVMPPAGPPQPGAAPDESPATTPAGDAEQQAPEEEQPGAEDSPEATQDATTAAALEALGVPADDEQDTESPDESPEVAKAVAAPGGGRVQRREGERWTVNGHDYTKKNGKIVEVAGQGGQKPAAGGPAAGGLVSVRDAIARHGDDAGKAIDELRGQMKEHMDKGGKVSLWFDGRQIPVTKIEGNRVLDAKGQPWGLLPLAMGTPGTKSGIEFHPAAPAPAAGPPPLPAHYHDQLAAKLLAGRPSLNLLTPDAKAHKITDGASVRAFFAKGGKLPDAAAVEAAGKVPAATPAAQKTLASVEQWATHKAAQHADRVAAHFGISREQAHKLLVHAITAVARHAAKTGGRGASGTVSVGGKKLRVTLPGKPAGGPTAGAPPRPDNPAGKGSLPPRVAKGAQVPAAAGPISERGAALLDRVLATQEG